MNHRCAVLLVMLMLLATTGASCPRQNPSAPTAPNVFYGTPTVGQIIDVVNANTSRVRQLQTTGARLAIEGAPRLQASLALERPTRFRLRGNSLIGNELDIGSNDEVFWMWARRNDPQVVFYARHDEFEPGKMANILPLPPTWLIEALGLITLDPHTAYDGPHASGPGRVELSYVTNDPTPLMKTIVLDDRHGQVLEQRVYDTNGQLLAAAQMSEYRYDSANATALPHVISVQLPPAQLGFRFQIESYAINALYAEPLSLWSMPQLPDTPYQNLAGM